MDRIYFDKCLSNKIMSEQFFGGTELENGFVKCKHFTTYWLKAFSSDTPQSIKRQNKGPKEHDENIYPVVDRKRPIRKNASTRPV